MLESKIVTADWLCDKCGYPVKLERKENEAGFGSIKNLHVCDREPAHIELSNLQVQLKELHRRLAKERDKANSELNGMSSFGGIFASHDHAIYENIIDLLHQAMAGNLKFGGND